MLPLLALFPLAALAQSDEGEGGSTESSISATVEYSSFCRTCPYNICTHTAVPGANDTYEATCWTNGDTVGSSDLWLRTTDDCYVPYYDLSEHDGDLTVDLAGCGEVPLAVTQQAAEVRFLSECKWGYSTNNETIRYYGRDAEVTLTCWSEGANIADYPYWFKTLDYCWVPGATLWWEPEREGLDWCGPDFGPRINDSTAPLDDNGAKPTPLPPAEDEGESESGGEGEAEGESEGEGEGEDEGEEEDNGDSLVRRWLEAGRIGEDTSPCYSRPGTDGTLTTEYVYEQTVYSQCFVQDNETVWMYTTDWCYVNAIDFEDPPSDRDGYPTCDSWGENWEELVG